MPVGPDVKFEFWFKDGDEEPRKKVTIKDDCGLTEDQWGQLVKGLQGLIWANEHYETKDTTGEPG